MAWRRPRAGARGCSRILAVSTLAARRCLQYCLCMWEAGHPQLSLTVTAGSDTGQPHCYACTKINRTGNLIILPLLEVLLVAHTWLFLFVPCGASHVVLVTVCPHSPLRPIRNIYFRLSGWDGVVRAVSVSVGVAQIGVKGTLEAQTPINCASIPRGFVIRLPDHLACWERFFYYKSSSIFFI